MTHARSSGFTLIELMLSMSFIAILLIAIAGTTIQIMHIYSKGVTVREVNQVGRTLSDDIKQTIAVSPRFTVLPDNAPGSKYITGAGGGRLCTGVYTYAWNIGKTKELGDNDELPSVYNTYEGGGGNTIRFVKVTDPTSGLCANPSAPARIPNGSRTTELLVAGDRNLAIQRFFVRQGDQDDASEQALYAVSFTLGTNNRSELYSSEGTTCRPPSEGSGSDDFCAINNFDMVIRSSNLGS